MAGEIGQYHGNGLFFDEDGEEVDMRGFDYIAFQNDCKPDVLERLRADLAKVQA